MIDNTSGSQLAFPLAGDDKASFENFWVGENLEIVNALRSLVSKGDPKVVYLYGPEGCGKSHLMYAVMRLARQAEVTTSYLSLQDTFVTSEMLEVVAFSGVVCIDNVNCWAGENDKERSLFTLFEQVKHAGGQLIVSAKQAPETSDISIKDLVSRLSSGLIYPLQELDDEHRFEALKMRSNHRGLIIGDDVLKFLVSRTVRDNTALFALLDKIDKASLVEKRKITIPFLQNLLSRES